MNVPVAETPFARDAAFSYGSANLQDYVEERLAAVKAAESSPSPVRNSGPPPRT
jgi:hypothetical protein